MHENSFRWFVWINSISHCTASAEVLSNLLLVVEFKEHLPCCWLITLWVFGIDSQPGSEITFDMSCYL